MKYLLEGMLIPIVLYSLVYTVSRAWHDGKRNRTKPVQKD